MLAAVLAAALTFLPVAGPAGTAVVAHAVNLAPSAAYTLVWHTGDPHWNVQDGKFSGIVAPDATHALAAGTSTASGTLDLRFAVPADFGYIHNVELQANGAAVATQGFTVVPKLTISPASGPLGTPITVTMSGVGYRFYQAVWHLMYDGAQTGWLSAITTHGTARVTVRATGAVGMHTLQALEGPTSPYLNVAQSPNYQPLIPTVVVQRFRLTAGEPVLPPAASAQQPPRDRTAVVAAAAGPRLTTDFTSGPVGSPIAVRGAGFAPATKLAVEWETIVGNDISGNGWETVRRPVATVTSDANGAFAVRAATPDDLGGTHRIVAHALDAGATETATAYDIVPSVVGFTATARPGGLVTIHVKGGGWSETGNIYTAVVDNASFGYACGFNTQGDITMTFAAPGQAGWHIVDLYPAIYNGKILGPGLPPQGSDSNGSYFLLPMLNVVDHPGERIPAYHLAILVRGT